MLSFCTVITGLAPTGCKKEPPPAKPAYQVEQGIVLPVSAASTPPTAGRQRIAIARERIRVDGRQVATLAGGRFRDPAEIEPVAAALKRAPTTILADADTPFVTLKQVIAAVPADPLDLVVRNGGVGGALAVIPLESPRAPQANGPTIALRPDGYSVVIDGKPRELDDEGELIRLVHQSKTAAPGQIALVNAVDDKPVQEVVRLLDLLRPDYPRVRFYLPAQ